MISLRFCPVPECHGLLRAIQTGAFHKDTRVAKLKCSKCGHVCCAVQFIAPIEVMKYARVINNHGEPTTAPRLRNPITVDLHPDLRPEMMIHAPRGNVDRLGDPYARDQQGRFIAVKDPWLT